MNKTQFFSFVDSRINSNQQALAALTEKLATTDAASDEHAAIDSEISEVKHRLRFLSVLNRAREDIASVVSQCKISADMLSECERDAKSLEKVTELFSSIADKRMIRMSVDDALAQAVDYLVQTSFAELTHDTLRQQLKSKKSQYRDAHVTDRQASMICKMFERLNVAQRTKLADKKASRFDTDSAIVQRIIEAYTA